MSDAAFNEGLHRLAQLIAAAVERDREAASGRSRVEPTRTRAESSSRERPPPTEGRTR